MLILAWREKKQEKREKIGFYCSYPLAPTAIAFGYRSNLRIANPLAVLSCQHFFRSLMLTFGGLGSLVDRQRGLLLLVSIALAAVSVAAAGTVSFVGLIAPHLGRQLVGPLHQGLIPTAGAIGGLIVVIADLLGRTLFAPIELPCGLITAAVGAPYFLYLLIQNRKR